MAYLDTKFTKSTQHGDQSRLSISTAALNHNRAQSKQSSNLSIMTSSHQHLNMGGLINSATEGHISPKNGFHIKYTPMQLYPKMLKVKVAAKQLGKKFQRVTAKENVKAYMQQTERMVKHNQTQSRQQLSRASSPGNIEN